MLSDDQLAYRVFSIVIQNIGEIGGRTTDQANLDYNKLSKWFYLLDELDPQSDYVPYLAAYNFTLVEDKDKLSKVIEYLKDVGLRHEENKWRWLAQAVYLARYKKDDLDEAMKYATMLKELSYTDRPAWTYVMDGIILSTQGKQELAYNVMMDILIEKSEQLRADEIMSIKGQICYVILEPEQAELHPLCEDHF